MIIDGVRARGAGSGASFLGSEEFLAAFAARAVPVSLLMVTRRVDEVAVQRLRAAGVRCGPACPRPRAYCSSTPACWSRCHGPLYPSRAARRAAGQDRVSVLGRRWAILTNPDHPWASSLPPKSPDLWRPTVFRGGGAFEGRRRGSGLKSRWISPAACAAARPCPA